MYNNHIALYAVIGAVLVGLLCDGVVVGTVSTTTLGAVVFALFVAMIGPGYDDSTGYAVIPAALVGAFVGWRFRGVGRKVGAVGKAVGDLRPAASDEESAFHERV